MPIVVLVYLFKKAFDFARRGLKPVAKIIPDQLVSGTTTETIMAVALIVLLCSSPDDPLPSGIVARLRSDSTAALAASLILAGSFPDTGPQGVRQQDR